MKNIKQLALVLVLISGLTMAKSVVAADVVGEESYTVSWTRTADTEKYQVYFDQNDANGKNNTVSDLDGRSGEITLSSLKACTTYRWNVKGYRRGRWDWLQENDQFFTTGGLCPKVVPTSTSGTAKIVGNASAVVTWTPIDGADYYNVYYRAGNDTSYTGGIRVPAEGTSVTINYLGGGTYYYKVSGMVNGKEVWLPEKVLKGNTASQPVLGAVSNKTPVKSAPQMLKKQTPVKQVKPVTKSGKTSLAPSNSRIGGTVAGATTAMSGSSKQGIAQVLWTNPGGAAKYHVYFWSATNDQHAIRDLSSEANQVAISYLNTSRTYWYRVQVVKNDGTTMWLSDAKMLNVQ